MYTVRDRKALGYLPPFLAANGITAKRLLIDSARDNGTLLGMHPDDFELYEIGEFDEQSGEVNPDSHEFLGKLSDIMEEANEAR